MNTTWYDYSTTILSKVSFDRRLMLKEYRKSMYYLEPTERERLRDWIISKFYPKKLRRKNR